MPGRKMMMGTLLVAFAAGVASADVKPDEVAAMDNAVTGSDERPRVAGGEM